MWIRGFGGNEDNLVIATVVEMSFGMSFHPEKMSRQRGRVLLTEALATLLRHYGAEPADMPGLRHLRTLHADWLHCLVLYYCRVTPKAFDRTP